MNVEQDAPADWPRQIRSRSRINAGLVMSLITLLPVKLAIDRAHEGDTWKAVAYIVGAIYLAHFVVIALSGMQRIVPSSVPPREGMNDVGERGIEFPQSLRTYFLALPSLGMSTIAAILLGVALIHRGGPGTVPFALACFAGSGFLAWVCYVFIRRGRGRLVLTPSGVYHHSGEADQFTPWETITDVRTWNGPIPTFVIDFELTARLRAHRSFGRFGPDVVRIPHIVCQASAYQGQTVPAYRTVRYYFENPDRRHEIGREH